MFYKHEYSKNARKIKSNARMEPKSKLGEYYKACQEFMQEDEQSHPAIYLLKGIFALIPGAILATLSMAPFSLAVLVISLVRLPINFYKTTKIALFTVVLRWDLRVVVLAMLPLIHTIFPLITLMCAIVGSFLWTWKASVMKIVGDDNLFDIWTKLREKLSDYYKVHEVFVGERCDLYDHPSGIPYGWDGHSYGIDFQRLLRWQRDFLVICFVIALGAPFCMVVAFLLSALKYFPGVINWWRKYCYGYCCGNENNCAAILSLWPFHVLAILLTPVGALISHISLVLFSLLSFPYQVINSYIEFYWCRGGTCRAVRLALAENMKAHDEFTALMAGDEDDWAMLRLQCVQPSRNEEPPPRGRPNSKIRDDPQLYWDRFVSQCICTAASLLEEGLVQLEDIQGLEPSAIQSIPAVAILNVLTDSIKDKTTKRGDLKWNIDGTVCKESDRTVQAGIARQLWPMVSSIECLLRNKQASTLTCENLEVLTSMLVANNESEPETTTKILAGADPKNHSLNNTVRTMINRMVLAILRVRPYQDRMNKIFTHGYMMTDLEQQNGNFDKEEAPLEHTTSEDPICSDSLKEATDGETNSRSDKGGNVKDNEDRVDGGEQSSL
eukprot:CAMPEP_0172571278 /NCGR_PEP_ID=MMETSP1067-20121228/130719_1 /TAXON_ID=265564 ORGANISM="Thalassiosira punctigera, Strain Tpunct2005C2" /NCGR_SAMPLE_ID=MMETSP1067 /ASSEMBLY_ACC=CAM_ASM_000444 /LENGTH=610 /DNA_ID=CAMNT_0013363565 /DNA_START=426 /DNA_END=2258 /DNA_ORIENTATION=-